MPYQLNHTHDTMNVAEQGYAYGWRVRMETMTSCICLAGRFPFGRVVAAHLVVVSNDGTVFDAAAAQSAASLVSRCMEVVVAGHLDCWAALPAFGALQQQINPKIVDLSGVAIHGLEFKTACRKLYYRTDGSGWGAA